MVQCYSLLNVSVRFYSYFYVLNKGLPSQLRDAVLSQVSNITLYSFSLLSLMRSCTSLNVKCIEQDDGTLTVPESEANQEYFASQHLALVASGNDPWQSGETPNEKLLKIARNAAVDREQSKPKLAAIAGKKRDARYNGLSI